jgi:hypothetical protein
MNNPKFLSKLIGGMVSVVLLAGCGASTVTPSISPTFPPPAPTQLPPPPVLTLPPPPIPTPGLTSDFTPCVGAPSGATITPAAGRALMAYSTNGFDFQRPANPSDGILIDRAGVTDGVVLPDGRLLVYFVNGCEAPNGTQNNMNVVVVAVSDQQGIPGSWVFKDVQFTGIPASEGFSPGIVDPNVVLLPDGSLRLFVTMFRPGSGTTSNAAYSFHSADGGFTFSFEGFRYDGTLDPENYRFSDSDWQIITGGPEGHALSTDGGNTFNSLGMFPIPPGGGAVHEIAVTDKPGEYRAYASTPDGIKSFLATSAPWTTWTEEAGYRLQVSTTTGLESCNVSFPTVLKLGPGNYLMIYLSVIPGCGCSDDPTCK